MKHYVALCLGLLVAALPGHCDSDICITKAFPCNQDGTGLPLVGDAYYLRVHYTVHGEVAAPIRIAFELANCRGEFKDVGRDNGGAYVYTWGVNAPTDGPLPWRVIVDSDGASGDETPANNVAEGVFEPLYPEAGIERYEPRTYDVAQEFLAEFDPRSGSIDFLRLICPPFSGQWDESGFGGVWCV